MKFTNIDQILLQLSLEVSSKANHDLLGAMHVVNFCTDEISSSHQTLSDKQLGDYTAKLSKATKLMANTIALDRCITNGLKAMKAQQSLPSLPLVNALEFARSLSLLYSRHLIDHAMQLKNIKKLRNISLSFELILALVPLFDWFGRDDGEDFTLIFEEDPNSELLLFSIPSGSRRIELLAAEYLKIDHSLFKYLEYLGCPSILERISKQRDIIGELKSTNGRDFFYLHIDLLQHEFSASFNPKDCLDIR